MKQIGHGKLISTAAILVALANGVTWGQSPAPVPIQSLPTGQTMELPDAAMIAALAGSPFVAKLDATQIPTLIEQTFAGSGKTRVARSGLFRFLQK